MHALQMLYLDAGQWRQLGLKVPPQVPDCAWVKFDGFEVRRTAVEGSRVSIEFAPRAPRPALGVGQRLAHGVEHMREIRTAAAKGQVEFANNIRRYFEPVLEPDELSILEQCMACPWCGSGYLSWQVEREAPRAIQRYQARELSGGRLRRGQSWYDVIGYTATPWHGRIVCGEPGCGWTVINTGELLPSATTKGRTR